MAEDSQTRHLCLPSHFPSGHLPLHGEPKARRDAVGEAAAFARACGFHFQTQGGVEGEAEEEDRLLAALTQTIARYFLTEDDGAEVVSPRAAIRSASDKVTPNGPSSPSPAEQRKEPERCDLLYEAASRVMRLRRLADLRHRQSLYAGGTLGPARKPAPAVLGAPENVTAGYYASDPPLSPEQLQAAAHFYHLKKQQSMKQSPAAAAWGRQSTARGCGVGGRPLDLPPQAWPPLPQPAAMFLNAAALRKESIGTGVFLPRVTSNNNKLEPKRKSACSRDAVPERTIQALNLNLEEFAARQHFPIDADAAIDAQISEASSHPKTHHLGAQPPPSAAAAAAAAAQEIVLPQEWTY